MAKDKKDIKYNPIEVLGKTLENVVVECKNLQCCGNCNDFAEYNTCSLTNKTVNPNNWCGTWNKDSLTQAQRKGRLRQ